jgi:hypothetical protein
METRCGGGAHNAFYSAGEVGRRPAQEEELTTGEW